MARDETPVTLTPETIGEGWIDELTDSQCMEIFWLYVDPPEAFLRSHPPALLGQAMRQALREVTDWSAAAEDDQPRLR